MTVNTLITATLRLIGVVAAAETPRAEDTQDAFARLNDMVDAWASERLTIYQSVRTTKILTASQASYTIGTAGNIAIARPIFLDAVALLSGTTEYPVELLTEEAWNAISQKTLESTWPTKAYYNPTYPSGTLSLWPVPTDSTASLVLYVPTAVPQFTSTGQTVSVPPGYQEALRYNLAVRLCPEFGRVLDPVVAALAVETKAALKRANVRVTELRVDDALLRGSAFDINTGE